MVNKYDNIDFCLNILYDFVYNKRQCYTLKHSQKDNIVVNDIKKPNNFDSTHIFKDSNIKFVSKINDKLVFKRYSKTSYPSTIVIGGYSGDNVNINSMTRGELIDMKMHYILSEISMDDKLKFTMLPVMNFDTDLDKFDKTTKDIIKNELNSDKLYVQIFEHYFKLQTLREFLDENVKQLDTNMYQNIFFQVLYALMKITNKYPSFRHNHLDLDSIWLYRKKTDGKSIDIKIGDSLYKLPNSGFEVKLTNFNSSYIKKIAENHDTKLTGELPYYDIHYFFQSLLNYINDKKLSLPKEVAVFYEKVLPENLRSKDNHNIGLDEEQYKKNTVDIITPRIILTKNNFFTQFINRKTMNSDSFSNTPENISKYNTRESSIDYSISSSITEQTSDNRMVSVGGRRNTNKNNQNVVTGTRRINDSGFQKKQPENKHVSEHSSISGGYSSSSSEIKASVGNSFVKLFKDSKQSNQNESSYKKKSEKSHHSRESAEPQNAIASQLPEGYQGPVPDWAMDKMNPGMTEGSMDPSVMAHMQSMNGSAGMPGMPGMPGMGMGMPGMAGMPGMGMPGAPQMGMPGMPSMSMPGMPSMGMPAMAPQMGMPDMPGMPGMSAMGMPGMPGASADMPNVSAMLSQHNMGAPSFEGSVASAQPDYLSQLPPSMLRQPTQMGGGSNAFLMQIAGLNSSVPQPVSQNGGANDFIRAIANMNKVSAPITNTQTGGSTNAITFLNQIAQLGGSRTFL